MTTPPKLLLSAFVPHQSPAFLGWLAYHRVIGVTHTYIFADRKSIGRMPLLDSLAAAGAVMLVPVAVDPDRHEEIRNSALRAAQTEFTESGGYGLYLALDEYFCINSRAKTIQSLMRACSGADVMSVPVKTTGHNVPDAAPHDAGLRSVVRLGLFPSRSVEVPLGTPRSGGPIAWVNGDGQPMPLPHSRLAWAGLAGVAGDGRASVLKSPVPATDIPTPELAPWSDAIAKETNMLMALPGVAAAQATLCAAEPARPDELRQTALETPLSILPHEEPETAETDPTTDAPIAEETGAELAATAGDPAPSLPPWFAEIHTGGNAQGFYTRLEHHAIICVRRDVRRLVVTFDNLSNVHDLSAAREPWAYKFVRDNNCSHLSVMARRKDWYRDPQLIAYLERLASDGFFRDFAKVFLTGTSMGGFAALAFSSLAPGATVISFNPQTTLDESLVPWETRFRMGRQRDWSLPYSDCAFEIDDIEKAFIFYDPFFEPDRRHVERLEGDNVIRLKTWFSGHYSPTFLRRADLLKPVMQQALDDTLTPATFYSLFRGRRHLPWYRKSLEGSLVERGHAALATRVAPAFRRLRKQAAE